jgi:hypothetical protein
MRSSSGYALLEGFRHLFKRLANEPALFPTDVNNLLARFDLERCLNPAMWQLGPSRDYVEQLRAYLFGSISCVFGREDRPAMLGVRGEFLVTTLGMGGPDDD